MSPPLRIRSCSHLAIAVFICATGVCLAAGANGRPRFFPDDPIGRDPETEDASNVQPINVSAGFDLVENSFLGAGDEADVHAVNVNTLDEVPDSSWFTNRLRPGLASADTRAAVRPPDAAEGPRGERWTITGHKSEGVTPGFTIRDERGETFWIKFDPRGFPGMASGAEFISTQFFRAFGYHVPDNYLATLRREMLTIAPEAMIKDEDGRSRQLTEADLDAIFSPVARQPDGTYRVLASRNLPGRPLGPFRYYGTRPDDPNDIFPHEHRRELRGLLAFSAWLNHDEVRSTNSLDTLVRAGDRQVVRHHLLDFGSTLGSGSVQAQSRRAGNEFVWESRPTLITMLTLGFYVRPWIKVDYPEIPAVGRFESTYFRPGQWKPDYPNPAFRNARPEDLFWAARIMSALSDEDVSEVVRAAQYSDPRATEYVTRTLLARRAKVLNEWLNGTNPIVSVALDGRGALTFQNAAEEAGVSKAAERYTIAWSRFDNAAGLHHQVGSETTQHARHAQAPAVLLESGADYISARLRAFHADHAGWSQPLVVYFRRAGQGWHLVGLERNP